METVIPANTGSRQGVMGASLSIEADGSPHEPRALSGLLSSCVANLHDRSAVPQEVVNRHADVLTDQPEQAGRDVPANMEWNGGGAAVRVPKLLMRAALPDFSEAETRQNRTNFSSLENRDVAHLCDAH